LAKAKIVPRIAPVVHRLLKKAKSADLCSFLGDFYMNSRLGTPNLNGKEHFVSGVYPNLDTGIYPIDDLGGSLIC
jgi:hypothetical protein